LARFRNRVLIRRVFNGHEFWVSRGCIVDHNETIATILVRCV